MKLRVGTRASRLAMAQSKQACESLMAQGEGLEFELVPLRTTGDAVTDRPLREAGGKGLFVKELDDALLGGRVDCAVHSLKDVPTTISDGIVLACVPERADPRDEMISVDGWGPLDVPAGSMVGTGSLRRGAQLLDLNADVVVAPIRGNVETRLRKVLAGDFAATFLAAAGLDRLAIDVSPARRVPLEPHTFVPSPGQGALCFTARADDTPVLDVLSSIEHEASRRAVEEERSCAAVMGGSCFLPVGAYAEVVERRVKITAVVCSPDGVTVIKDTAVGATGDTAGVGRELGERLLGAGAGDIIAGLEPSA